MLDRIFYKNPLKLVHLFGFITLIIASSLISLSNLIQEKIDQDQDQDQAIIDYTQSDKTYIPVLLAITVAISWSGEIML